MGKKKSYHYGVMISHTDVISRKFCVSTLVHLNALFVLTLNTEHRTTAAFFFFLFVTIC